MASRKKQRFNDYSASLDKNDNYGTMFVSMCQSKAFQSLTCGAKNFYVLCRVQAQSEQGRRCLYRHADSEGKKYISGIDFVFPAKHQKAFGIANSNGSRYFKELIKKGFIELKEQNKHRHKPNVYTFSTKWKGF